MTGPFALIGALIVLAGAAFLFLGGLGLYRMPDSYTRIQAGTKATTLGTLLVLAGAAFLMPGWWIKLMLILLFLMFTNPLSSQVLARAAHRAGIRPAPETRADALADDQGDAS
ncbi:monovalent cation/H(+) antiporter subunit G [Sinisalibacter aestuarii]|uniref:Na+/H+ antiporter subunit G n=1 Tax=Sinisalibacter aestuarii TaxID=2949426 RepID=A0ABQ5LQV3_9RHOB|nr:monovalent cation/H(+) antiporter subunit G [Sinisalibacter aestuarii]GKY87338.1 Na+/H+ antiporter subunit G [Sinisalibacter aestuarii]